jgi:hypothetical protein
VEEEAVMARIVLVAVGLAAVAAGAAHVIGGAKTALGGAAGALVAAGYSWSFLRSHVAKARGTRFDSRLAEGALARLVAAAVVGYAMLAVPAVAP